MMPGGGAASGPARPFASAGQPLNQPLGSGGAQVAPPRSLSQPPPTASISPAPAPNANNAAPPRAPVANPSASGGTVPRAPINPFLANDPHAKAKRLARALVSDLVTYFPQKRDEGLRDGTLKQLFKDEIQKSYEEYTLQVGREFAESTPHFQEALNDILARGQKVF